jgi:hypothetical protein
MSLGEIHNLLGLRELFEWSGVALRPGCGRLYILDYWRVFPDLVPIRSHIAAQEDSK